MASFLDILKTIGTGVAKGADFALNQAPTIRQTGKTQDQLLEEDLERRQRERAVADLTQRRGEQGLEIGEKRIELLNRALNAPGVPPELAQLRTKAEVAELSNKLQSLSPEGQAELLKREAEKDAREHSQELEKISFRANERARTRPPAADTSGKDAAKAQADAEKEARKIFLRLGRDEDTPVDDKIDQGLSELSLGGIDPTQAISPEQRLQLAQMQSLGRAEGGQSARASTPGPAQLQPGQPDGQPSDEEIQRMSQLEAQKTQEIMQSRQPEQMEGLVAQVSQAGQQPSPQLIEAAVDTAQRMAAMGMTRQQFETRYPQLAQFVRQQLSAPVQ